MRSEQRVNERDVEEDMNLRNTGMELELECVDGVFELMIELGGTSIEGGAAKEIGVGIVESLQEERS